MTLHLPPGATIQVTSVDSCPNGTPDEVLYQSKQTRVFRRLLPNGASIICKERLTSDGAEQQRHERKILERLAGIEGVPRLVNGAASTHVVSMEDTGGVPLSDAVRLRRLEVPVMLELALGLSRIIASVHRCGVLHKDIKPANILLCGPQRKPMLIDFRLASIFSTEQPGFTHHREIVGTLAYLAPEQTGRTGRSVDERADLYALGTVLYELATGYPPFMEADPLQLIHDHLARQPTPPRALNAKLPQDLSDVILRLLEKEPDRRYQSAEGLAHDLSRLVERQARGDSGPFLIAERDFASRLLPPSRLIGRQAELAALQAALQSACSGKGYGMVVTGPPGVGKTALLNELRPIVTAQRGWFVFGKYDQYRHDAPAAGTQALRALGRLLLAEPETELLHHRARIRAALGNDADLLTAVFPEYALLLGVQSRATPRDQIEPDTRLRKAILELLRAVASPTRPLVMVLDDLQWADRLSLRLIDGLLTAEHLHGLLLVCAYRETEGDAAHQLSTKLPAWSSAGAAPRLLRLQSLPPADLGSLLSEMLRLPKMQAARLADAVGMHTNGNPYDTVELLNGLRRDGALLPCNDGWGWDAATIHQYVGQGSTVERLTARIGRLPPEARALLEIMACLGGELKLSLLRAATGLSAANLEERLAPSHQEGLVLVELGDDSAVRFRHDRVHQAAYGGLDLARQRALHVALARRLAGLPELFFKAAEQYLPVFDTLEDPDECRRAAQLFRQAADKLRRAATYVSVERYLAAAIALLERWETPGDKQQLAALASERHAALHFLGRLEEADKLYSAIEQQGRDPLDLVHSTCLQISSLTNRGAMDAALKLGFRLLHRLGAAVPDKNFATGCPGQLDEFYQWLETICVDTDLQRPEPTDPSIIATASLANKLMTPAVFSDPNILAWLVLDGQRRWAEHGPCAALVFRLSQLIALTIDARGDYLGGYSAMRHMLAVSEGRGYEPASSQARLQIAVSALHWFEPLEMVAPLAQGARDGLIRGGELQIACYSYCVAFSGLLHSAATLDSCASEIEPGLALAESTGTDHSVADLLVLRQLVRTLRGEIKTPGGFSDGTYDEATHAASMAAKPLSLATFHVYRAFSAALFDDAASLARHVDSLIPLVPVIRSFYLVALAYLLQALVLADKIKARPLAEHTRLLADLDACSEWLKLRAKDAPYNFLHLMHFVEAERAWAVGERWEAACAFDAARREAERRQRPWQQALIAERAGLFHLAHGLEHAGQTLLGEAERRYAAWGAKGKVRELARAHAFLRSAPSLHPSENGHQSRTLSADSIDLLGILRASQVLSSETSIKRIRERLGDLLGEMTGATNVLLVVWHDCSQQWFLQATDTEGAIPLAVETAAARVLLPLSAFHYAERTREPLLVEDATRDDRFARDPYLAGVDMCSLLVVPILNRGSLRAMVLLENRLSRGTFSTDRLDAVMLIAGQLAVSLDNAMVYASLEQKVSDRTQELANSLSLLNATLESTADGIVAMELSRRVVCYNKQFAVMWGIPTDMLERLDSGELVAFISTQVRNAERFVHQTGEHYAAPDAETFDVIELKDGRIFERYVKPQRVDAKCVGLVVSWRDVTARTRAAAELESIHKQLLDASRRSGMAEIATNVLHNVGNVLTCVNVSANLLAETVMQSKVSGLTKAADLVREHASDLAAFITEDFRGKQLPSYLCQLAECLMAEQKFIADELFCLRDNVDHIKEIVAMQQRHATVSGLKEIVDVRELLEASLRINAGGFERHGIELIREFADVPPINLDKHRILQVLVNLVRNAKYACEESDRVDKRLTVRVENADGHIRISVIDNGVGIPPENLPRIFNHGFTTRPGGHGFGLHSGALAANEMGGLLTVHSDGEGHGATFTLDLPHEMPESGYAYSEV